MLKNIFISCLTVAVSMVLSLNASAGSITANPANGEKIFHEGKGDVPACESCHGEKGMGMDAMQTPRLANIGYAYMVKQLTNFANDERTDLTLGVMNTNAKGLTEQDRRDVAAYVNTLNNPPDHSDLKALKEEGTPVGQIYLGQIIVKYGIKDKVSACQSCHGYNGRGNDPIYPMIGQQKYVYLVNQLTRWRDESRANDLMGQMRAIAKNLTDDDIHNVAAFLSQAPVSTPGNSFVPNNQPTLKNVLGKN
jgi:cytochrome c553